MPKRPRSGDSSLTISGPGDGKGSRWSLGRFARMGASRSASSSSNPQSATATAVSPSRHFSEQPPWPACVPVQEGDDGKQRETGSEHGKAPLDGYRQYSSAFAESRDGQHPRASRTDESDAAYDHRGAVSTCGAACEQHPAHRPARSPSSSAQSSSQRSTAQMQNIGPLPPASRFIDARSMYSADVHTPPLTAYDPLHTHLNANPIDQQGYHKPAGSIIAAPLAAVPIRHGVGHFASYAASLPMPNSHSPSPIDGLARLPLIDRDSLYSETAHPHDVHVLRSGTTPSPLQAPPLAVRSHTISNRTVDRSDAARYWPGTPSDGTAELSRRASLQMSISSGGSVGADGDYFTPASEAVESAAAATDGQERHVSLHGGRRRNEHHHYTAAVRLSPVFQPRPLHALHEFEPLVTLGTGTFGRVLLVRLRSRPQSDSSGYFALKVLSKADIVRLKQVTHTNNERSILSKTNHPFVVDLYCTYQDPYNCYMLMEYVVGGEVFSHLRKARRFTVDVTRFYIASLVLALAYLHSEKVLYRDLKPENLLLDRHGYIKIADFGFAKELRTQDRTWTLCGTPEYLSPEVIQSQGQSFASDYWALGILMFEMLCGFPPFYDSTPFGTYEKILQGNVAFPKHVDPRSRDLVLSLLTKDVSRRLGNLSGGALDVMRHPWFDGVDWHSLLAKRILAPIIPVQSHPGDSGNFQKYDGFDLQRMPALRGVLSSDEDRYEGLFRDF